MSERNHSVKMSAYSTTVGDASVVVAALIAIRVM